MITDLYLKIILGAFYAAAAAFGIFAAMYSEKVAKRKRDACLKVLDAAITRDTLQDSDLDEIIALHKIPEETAPQILRALLERYLTEEGKDPYAKRVRELITSYRERRPYSELPDDIRLQLNQITDRNPDQKSPIGQLAHSLTDIYRKRKLESQSEKRKSSFSLIFGGIGLLFSLITLLPSCSTKNQQHHEPTVAQPIDK